MANFSNRTTTTTRHRNAVLGLASGSSDRPLSVLCLGFGLEPTALRRSVSGASRKTGGSGPSGNAKYGPHSSERGGSALPPISRPSLPPLRNQSWVAVSSMLASGHVGEGLRVRRSQLVRRTRLGAAVLLKNRTHRRSRCTLSRMRREAWDGRAARGCARTQASRGGRQLLWGCGSRHA